MLSTTSHKVKLRSPVGKTIKCPQCSEAGKVFLENFRYTFYCSHCNLHTYLKALHTYLPHTPSMF